MVSGPLRSVAMKGAWPSSTEKSPSAPGTVTIWTSADRSRRAGVTSSNFRAMFESPPSRLREGSGEGLFRIKRRARPPTDPPLAPPASGRGTRLRLFGELRGLGDRFVDAADHV